MLIDETDSIGPVLKLFLVLDLFLISVPKVGIQCSVVLNEFFLVVGFGRDKKSLINSLEYGRFLCQNLFVYLLQVLKVTVQGFELGLALFLKGFQLQLILAFLQLIILLTQEGKKCEQAKNALLGK